MKIGDKVVARTGARRFEGGVITEIIPKVGLYQCWRVRLESGVEDVFTGFMLLRPGA